MMRLLTAALLFSTLSLLPAPAAFGQAGEEDQQFEAWWWCIEGDWSLDAFQLRWDEVWEYKNEVKAMYQMAKQLADTIAPGWLGTLADLLSELEYCVDRMNDLFTYFIDCEEAMADAWQHYNGGQWDDAIDDAHASLNWSEPGYDAVNLVEAILWFIEGELLNLLENFV